MPICITPSGNNTAGEQYRLTCTFISSIATTSFTWFGPPNGGPLPSDNSDTRMVSDVMSNGSTHTSILQFDPLQSSHEGNYICQVTVGAIVEMVSFQINLVTMPTATSTTTTDGGGSPDGVGGGVNGGAIAGAIIVVLLLVAVIIVVAVVLFLYWRYD